MILFINKLPAGKFYNSLLNDLWRRSKYFEYLQRYRKMN